jgi:hypothetical protein
MAMSRAGFVPSVRSFALLNLTNQFVRASGKRTAHAAIEKLEHRLYWRPR